MGNGESTTRRISMQRSDEGTIQISEDVMLRLKGQNNNDADTGPGINLLPGERIIHEEDLKLLLEKTYKKGFHDNAQNSDVKVNEIKRKLENDVGEKTRKVEAFWKEKLDEEQKQAQEQLEQVQVNVNEIKSKLEDDMSEKIRKVEALWKDKLGEEQKQAQERLEQVQDSYSSDHAEIEEVKKKAAEQEEEVNNMLSKLAEERKVIQEKLSSHEKELTDEFNRSAEDVVKQITPLQQSPLCSEVQAKVLECYKANKQQPLKCSQEVKEFVACVQAARLKLMQNKLMNK